MSITSPIIPAIIPQSYDDLVSAVHSLAGLPEVHVDVVDGVFAPNSSWPYTDSSNVAGVYSLLQAFSLEVDLMVDRPLVAAKDWLTAGADQLVFHIETISVESLKSFIEAHSVTVGVAISSPTPLEKLYPYLPFVDYVQVMGIAAIGTQGQPFDESVIARIKTLSAKFPNLPLSIDGSVNVVTLERLKLLPLARFIVGSAIMGAPDPKAAYVDLTKMAHS
jgi:pentose-5-phosphate-3-epimerase